MTLGAIARHAIRNLKRHKLRTVLTAIGVAVGAGTIVLLVSFAIGLRESSIEQLQTSEMLTQITVRSSRGAARMFEPRRFDEPRVPLTDEVITELADIPGVASVYPNLMAPVLAELEGDRRSLQVAGLPVSAISKTLQDSLLAGDVWKTPDEKGILLPSYLLKTSKFESAESAVGSAIRLHSHGRGPGSSEPSAVVTSRILGVFDTDRLGLAGYRAYAPMAFVRTLIERFGVQMFVKTRRGNYRALTVRVDRIDDVETVRKAIEERGLGTFTMSDLITQVRNVFFFLEAILAVFGGIGLVVAFFGIVNTMLMAALERRQEIGIMKAIGARNRDIRRLFLVEAALIGLFGGLFGLLGGWLLGAGIEEIARAVIASRGGPADIDLSTVSPALAGGVILFSLVVALVAGWYPAWRAGRLEPIEAIRR